jgi:hypothetical protein
MTLQRALSELVVHLREHGHELSVLSTIVAEDAPGGAAFVDRLQDGIETARGFAAEALAAADAALDAVAYPPELGRSKRELTAAHRALARLGRSLASDVGSSRHMDELRRLSAEQGGEWAAWAVVVRDTIQRCVQQLHGVNDDLVTASEEIIDPELVSVAVSVRMPPRTADKSVLTAERNRAETERQEEMP